MSDDTVDDLVDEAVARDEARRIPVDARIFLFTAVFFAVVGSIYAAASQEWAGVTLLGLCAVFSLIVFSYLMLREHHHTIDTEPDAPHDRRHEPYFPKASLWPFGVGAGLVTTLAGLALGLWVFFPGLALLLRSVVGWARQSKLGY